MNGPSSARGAVTAGWRLLAAGEKSIHLSLTREETALIRHLLTSADGSLMPCLRAHTRQTNPPGVFIFLFSSRYVNKRLYTCYYGVTYLLC